LRAQPTPACHNCSTQEQYLTEVLAFCCLRLRCGLGPCRVIRHSQAHCRCTEGPGCRTSSAGRRPDAGGAACHCSRGRLPTAQAGSASDGCRMGRLPVPLGRVRPDFDAAGTAALMSKPSSKPTTTELSACKDEFRTNWRALLYRAESAHLLGLGRLCCSSAAGRGYAFCSVFNDFNPAGGRASDSGSWQSLRDSLSSFETAELRDRGCLV
jgi:hypothetical protein